MAKNDRYNMVTASHAHAPVYKEWSHPYDREVTLSGEVCTICGQGFRLKWNGMSWQEYKDSLGIKPAEKPLFGQTMLIKRSS